ncbi:MAG TPA: ribonuclease P protein component [Candidatus Methanoperedens sp.]|nr:ribonuclease P protein component [Candidatus Methanoperedens sp.]
MGEFAFPPGRRLKRPSDYRAVFNRGTKRHTKGFILFRAQGGSDAPRLGLSVGRKVGGAVVRNRVKRLLRESFRLHWREWDLDGADLVVIAKLPAVVLSLNEVSRELSGAVATRSRR